MLDRGMDHVIAVMSKKGGVGKTASALHLAAHAGMAGHRTLLIDGDNQQFARGWIRSEVPFDLMDVEAGIPVMDGYDVVVIDAQGGLPDEDVRVLGELATTVLLPCVPEWQSVRGMADAAQMLDEAGVDGGKIRVLLTMDLRQGQATADARAELEGAGLRVLGATIRNSVAVRHASTAGTLVQRVPGVAGKMVFEDYRQAARELGLIG
ncbi:chromosome partitioning protein ParA [Deinococcus indicus]|nr:chromosome partitioning protein ParA [Deinococcus indicus]